jgi:hypothetical protein
LPDGIASHSANKARAARSGLFIDGYAQAGGAGDLTFARQFPRMLPYDPERASDARGSRDGRRFFLAKIMLKRQAGAR